MKIQKRSILLMVFLTIITFGFYIFYWRVATKLQLNRSGAHIPTAWLMIIPLANIYFLYKFAEGFCTVIRKNDSETIIYFLLLLLLPPIAPLIMQDQINKAAQ